MTDAQHKILVVDDTPANVKLLVDVLGAKGFAVTAAVNGEEALVKVAQDQPDLILLDIMMPGCRVMKYASGCAPTRQPPCCRLSCVPRSTRSRNA